METDESGDVAGRTQDRIDKHPVLVSNLAYVPVVGGVMAYRRMIKGGLSRRTSLFFVCTSEFAKLLSLCAGIPTGRYSALLPYPLTCVGQAVLIAHL